jgi:hypothetical protein
MESEMRRGLLAAVTVVNLFASPALAQSFTPELGSGNIAHAPWASNQVAPLHGHVRQPRSYDAYAQSPGAQFRGPAYGQRWPGARYDQNGYYIDPNSPGRW